MLYSLHYFDVGMPFPPTSETDRLNSYHYNRKLWQGEHATVYQEALSRIESVVGNFSDVVSYPIIINFQRLISLKTADFLLGEPPVFTSSDADSPEQITVNTICDNSFINSTLFTSVIDASRFGDSILLITRENGLPAISAVRPDIWFPVCNQSNIKDIAYHVLAWVTELEDKSKVLDIHIHSKGSVEIRRHEMLADGTIGEMISPAKVTKTGLSDFAVFHIPNTETTDSIFGSDDYAPLDSIISEIMVRISQISKVIDKHATPSVSGPTSALELNRSTGEWQLKLGNYFPRDSENDPDIRYITWDGQLEASFKQLDKLLNLLYTVSEMGTALMGDLGAKSGMVPSGSALKRLLILPLARVNRLRLTYDSVVKNVIKAASKLGGKGIVDLSNKSVSVCWQDGLPNDPKEMAELTAIRTAGKPTLSMSSAIKMMDNLADNEVASEVKSIINDIKTI